MTEAPVAKRLDWGRWFGRPGRSLTRRLIWLASAWILVALVIAALVLLATLGGGTDFTALLVAALAVAVLGAAMTMLIRGVK